MMSNPDDTLDLLRDFLPDIEHELRNQIEPELEEEFAERMQRELARIEQQAEQEYGEALGTLQEEFEQLKGEKMHELERELVHLQQVHQERERLRLAQAQERFLQEHFDDRIMAHPSLEQLQDTLESEIAEALFVKYSQIREKRVKELRVRLQGREQKERLEADRVIRGDIYGKSGLEGLKEDLQKFKVAIAAQKSQYNLRMAKLVGQVKALQKKCSEIEYHNSDLLIEQMEGEIEELQRQLTQQEQSEPSSFDDSSNGEGGVDFGDNFSRNKPFTHGQLDCRIGQAQFINQQVDFDSQDSLEQSLPCPVPPPPAHSRSQLLQQLILSSDSDHPQEITLQMPPKPLLNFDIGRMLREQWEEDSFDRYLSQRDKENDSRLPNQGESNFQSLYCEHLRKLNHSSRVPRGRGAGERRKVSFLSGRQEY